MSGDDYFIAVSSEFHNYPLSSKTGTFGFSISGGFFSYWSKLDDDLFYNEGENANVGIGKIPEEGNKLDVAGKINTDSISLNDHLTIKSYNDGNIHFVTNGYIGIGSAEMKINENPEGYKLVVPGKIGTHGVKIENTSAILNMPDYVFDPDYKLRPVEEVEKYVREQRHLPGIPSAEEFKENGLEVDQMVSKLLEKIEELTLYVIDLKKENSKLEERVNQLEADKD